MVVDLGKKVLKKDSEKATDHNKKDLELNENRIRVRFEKRVKELVSVDAPDLWKTF